MKIVKIQAPQEKSRVCEGILRGLPLWFGIESAIVDYVKNVAEMETWAAMDSGVVGFLSLKKHNPKTAEIYVMGVLSDHQGRKIGSQLIETAEESLKAQGFQFLTVKTLSESRPDEHYDKTRRFYLKYGFTPVEEFPTLWDQDNPCLMLVKNVQSFSYAVIFSSQRSKDDSKGYDKVSQRMIELAEKQKGFIKAESSRDSAGIGITVSYWKTLEDIKAWKAHSEHVEAQELGRSQWYQSFSLKICRVEREYDFSKCTEGKTNDGK